MDNQNIYVTKTLIGNDNQSELVLELQKEINKIQNS